MDLKFELLLIFLLTSNLYWLNYYVQQWLDESSAEWVDCGENGVCPVDLTKKAAKVIENLMYWGEPVVVVLSLFIKPFAILSPAFNNRITTAIRLFAINEGVMKILYFGKFVSSTNMCQYLHSLAKSIKCKGDLYDTVSGILNYLPPYYVSFDLAIYSQTMISISRYLAVSFDGLLFRYSTKWPFLQLAIPFLIRYAFLKYDELVWDQGFNPNSFIHSIQMFPQFLMCALDLMTWRRIRKLNRDGKVSRAENLLMTQMLFNTFAVMGVILFNGLGAFVASYFGLNIRGMIPELFGKLQLIVVLIGTSLMNAIFLHKPREKTKTNGKIVQVTNTKDSD